MTCGTYDWYGVEFDCGGSKGKDQPFIRWLDRDEWTFFGIFLDLRHGNVECMMEKQL